MKAFKIIRWVITNSLMAYFFYLAINGNVGFERVVVFIAWLSALSWISIYKSISDGEDKFLKQVGNVPEFAIKSYNIIFLIIFIYFGWWATSIAWLIGSASENSAYSEAKKQTTKGE